MGRGKEDESFLLKIQAEDSAQRIRCRRAGPARFRSSLLCSELSLRALLAARCRGNFSSGTVAPFGREKIHRRTQDRHAAARCVRKVAKDQDARLAIAATLRSQERMSASGRGFKPQ